MPLYERNICFNARLGITSGVLHIMHNSLVNKRLNVNLLCNKLAPACEEAGTCEDIQLESIIESISLIYCDCVTAHLSELCKSTQCGLWLNPDQSCLHVRNNS